MSTVPVPQPDSGGTDDRGRGGGRRTLAQLLALLEGWLSRQVNVVPYVRPEEARRAAESRREALVEALSREAPRFEEVPRRLEDERGAEEPPDEKPDSAAALAMEWELEDDRLLLLGRLSDYVRAALRSYDIHPLVVLEPLRPRLAAAEPALFPWRVVVRTELPGLVKRRLREVLEAPGIGVDVAPTVPPQPQRACEEGDGRHGIAPGHAVGPSGGTYQMTCAHVVDSSCHCSVWPPRHVSRRYSGPDAVLLRAGGCFQADGGPGQHYNLAPRDEWDRLTRSRVFRLGASEGNREGRLLGPMDGFRHEDGYSKMPSLLIEPRRRRYGILPWPLFRRGFSRKGDSGDWVVGGEAGDIWLGMIVQGSPTGSVAHQAAALVEYFNRELGPADHLTGPYFYSEEAS